MCRIKNPIAMAASRIFSPGISDRADDLLADHPAREESSLADIAALHRPFQFVSLAMLSTRDKVLVLPNNAISLATLRFMQSAEQRSK
jgi:hypothetical protein